MKKILVALFTTALFSTAALANNDAIRQDLLNAQVLINSALARLDAQQDYSAIRKVYGAQYICRDSATTPEVMNAISSVRQELKARCGHRCEVVIQFNSTRTECEIIGNAYPTRY